MFKCLHIILPMKGFFMEKKFCLLTLFSAVIFLFTSCNVCALREIQSETEFNQIIQQKPHVVVDFYASWCAPCQRMMTVLSDIEKEFPNVTFIKVNIDLLKNLADTYKVLSIPTLIFFKGGAKIDRVIGLLTKNQLQEKIQKLFA